MSDRCDVAIVVGHVPRALAPFGVARFGHVRAAA
jgi:hypothetical protein